jgi:hypothetical protein
MRLRGTAPSEGAQQPVIGRLELGEPDPAIARLLGSWSATRWQYTSQARPDVTADVVCDLGGSVTLSLSAATYVLA